MILHTNNGTVEEKIWEKKRTAYRAVSEERICLEGGVGGKI